MNSTHYVIDGRSLPQRSSWTIDNTCTAICQSYICYLQNNYGSLESTTVVFDGGYLNHSTKDTTHLRKNNGGCNGYTCVTQSFEI